MSTYPWASETREARADRIHRISNEIWNIKHPAKRVEHKHDIPFVTEAQKVVIEQADAMFWAAEKAAEKTEKSILHWLGIKA